MINKEKEYAPPYILIKRCLKKIIEQVFIKIIIFIGCIFYDKKYIQGRWFTPPSIFHTGYKWIFKGILYQKILGFNKHIPWPVGHRMDMGPAAHIHFHPDDLNNFQTYGTFFQSAYAHIYIGYGTYIAQNVGIITGNHDFNDLSTHSPGKDVRIGDNCWIGMNAVLLPGVELGKHTIVGAGAIVTKSFLNGNCVIAGNPAKIIKNI
jgi:acetyltransferase-like isoleucine patch superfamily enzyme